MAQAASWFHNPSGDSPSGDSREFVWVTVSVEETHLIGHLGNGADLEKLTIRQTRVLVYSSSGIVRLLVRLRNALA